MRPIASRVILSSAALIACQAPIAKRIDAPDAESVEVHRRAAEERLDMAPPRDRLVHLLDCGLLQLRDGDLAAASTSFDEASGRLGLLFGESADRSLTLWGTESDKEFKGEPFEQSLCFFYRGWTELSRGDLARAKSAFLAASLADRTQGQRSDFALPLFFEALTRWRLGEREEAQERLRWLERLDPGLQPLCEQLRSERWNTVVLIAAGAGPRKTGGGDRFATLGYVQDFGEVVGFELSHGYGRASASELCSSYRQATEPGDRLVDQLNRAEAGDRTKAEGFGLDSLRIAGIASIQRQQIPASSNTASDSRDFAAAAAVIGIGSLALGALINSGADVRAWSCLPEYLFVALLDVQPADARVVVTPLDANGAPVGAPVSFETPQATVEATQTTGNAPKCVYATF